MKRYLRLFLIFVIVLLVHEQRDQTLSQESDLREMKVKGVVMDPQGNSPVVILEEPQEHRAFPIWIGLPEARAIALELESVPTPRPFTHVLLKNILATLQVEVVHIVIHDIRDHTFYATITLRTQQQTLAIDARPSDAIALALSSNAPIFATTNVLGAVHSLPSPGIPPSLMSTQTLGMHIQNLDASLASFFHVTNTDGVLVAFVETASEAERYGMRQGDVITSVNGKAVKDVQDLLAQFKDTQHAQGFLLHIMREKQKMTIRLSSARPQP